MGRKLKPTRPKVLDQEKMKRQLENYEPKAQSRTSDSEISQVTTIAGMCELLARRPDIELDARVMGFSESGIHFGVPIGKQKFLETVGSSNPPKINFQRFREQFNDSLNSSIQSGYGASNTGLVGSDFVPLLGGPFNHQQYII